MTAPLGGPQIYRDEDVPGVREYIDHVGMLNQLHCIATQLRGDAAAGRHKYAAHKIALLYHAINSSKLARDRLRKRIEEHFEDVKDATEAEGTPLMPPHLADWIVGLCDEAASPPSSLPAAPSTHPFRAAAGEDQELCPLHYPLHPWAGGEPGAGGAALNEAEDGADGEVRAASRHGIQELMPRAASRWRECSSAPRSRGAPVRVELCRERVWPWATLATAWTWTVWTSWDEACAMCACA